ncbi:MAG: hypothetical protein R3E89_02555 [Thiolinea sp.]
MEAQAGINLRDSWLAVKALPATASLEFSDSTRGFAWNYAQYGEPGSRASVGWLTVEGVAHGWIGGHAGEYSDPRGPNLSEIIWLFCQCHPRVHGE